MPTPISTLITEARRILREASPRFWSDAELFDIAKKGIFDLWGAILDLNEEHFLVVDETNVTLPANATQLAGVPTDVFRVHLIEPKDLGSASSARSLHFEPKDYNHPDFQVARALGSLDPQGRLIYYTLIKQGPPVGAPTILVAPKINATVALRLVYVPALSIPDATANNPIPGESDHAIVAWIVAFARAKEREERAPDPEWLAVYATEKRNLLIRLKPRQTQEPTVVDAVFEHLWL